MNKIFFVLAIFLFLFSCSDNNVKSADEPYNLSVDNEKAYDFYKSAKLKSRRGDFVGAKLDFEASLRIDPKFIMSCIEINESNIKKKNQYIKRAISNYNEATETEKVFIDLISVTDQNQRIDLLRKLVALNPNNSDAYFLLGNSFSTTNLDSLDYYFKKSTEINPQNWEVNRARFFRKYPGFGTGSPLVKQHDNFFKYPDSVNVLTQDIKELSDLDTLNAQIYRKFGDIWRQSNDLEKARDYYLKGVSMCDFNANSFRSELLHTAGNATFLTGDVDQALKYYMESLEIEFDPYPRMKRVYQLATAYLFDQNHSEAIEVLDNYEKNLSNSGFNESEISQILVSIYNYKAFFFADMGDKKRSMESLSEFKKYAKIVLKELPDFNSSYINMRNRNLGLNSGLNDRLIRIIPENMIYDEIWINILNGNIDYSEKILKDSKLNNNLKNAFRIISNYYSGKYLEVINIANLGIQSQNMDTTSTPLGGFGNTIFRYQLNYFKYYIALSMLELNMVEEAKSLLKDVADSRSFGWTTGLVKKEAIEKLNNI